MKLCFTCKTNERTEYASYCLECKRLRERAYQSKDRNKFNARTKTRRNGIAQTIYLIKESNPCTDCGKFDKHYLMEYDHIGEKYMGIAAMISANKSLAVILEEMGKCELVCVRCHKIRTYIRSRVEVTPI